VRQFGAPKHGSMEKGRLGIGKDRGSKSLVQKVQQSRKKKKKLRTKKFELGVRGVKTKADGRQAGCESGLAGGKLGNKKGRTRRKKRGDRRGDS